MSAPGLGPAAGLQPRAASARSRLVLPRAEGEGSRTPVLQRFAA